MTDDRPLPLETVCDTAPWPEGPTPQNLVARLRDACQRGREIIEPWDHDPFLFDEAADEIERLRSALETIAGKTTDKLMAIQAKAALPNIGPRHD